jgi:predicted nuclease with TOPRIM domain
MIDLSLLSLILVVLLALALLVLWKREGELRHIITEKEQQLRRHQEELKALYTGAAGVGSHLARLENQINSLTDRQEHLDVRDPTTHNYNLAIDLVHQGADADELVRQCGLLHEEAELLVRLHGAQSLG